MKILKNLIFYIPFFIVVLFFTQSFGQDSGYLKGKVKSGAEDSHALTGALIISNTDKSVGTVSDVYGNYFILLKPGEHKLICSFLGMISDTINITISSGDTLVKDIILLPSVNEMDAVVVTAGRYEQKLNETTVSMQLIKSDLIESRNTVNIKDVLEQAPGMVILDEEPQIRGGSGFSFGVGSRVAVLIDGLPIMTGDAGRTDWSFIPTENIEQIEIVEGASSVLFGSSALSGTINFRTKYPTESSRTYVRLYSGFYSAPENNEAKWWSGNANFSGLNFSHAQRMNQVDLIIGGQASYDHNYIGPYILDGSVPIKADTLDNSDVADKSVRMNMNFRYRPVKADRLTLGVNANAMQSHSNFSLVWGNSSDQIYRAFPGTMTLSNSLGFYVDPYVSYFTRKGVRHELKGRYFYSDNDNNNGQGNKTDVFLAEYDLQKTFYKLGELNLAGGLFYNDSYSHAELYAGSGKPDNTYRNSSAFVQLDKKFFNIITLQAGVRGEYFKINDEEEVLEPVFRSGLNMQIFRGTSLRFSYGQGYRFPTLAEKFIITTTGGIYVFPNPDIQPESSVNIEAGIKQGIKIGKFLGYIDASWFRQRYYDAIEYIYAIWKPDSAGFKFVNTGDAKVEGFEFSLMGKGNISENVSLTVIAGYTYVLPKTLNPEMVFATDNPADGIIPTDLTYTNTSTDPSEDILKYRFRHIVKGDVEIGYKKIALGAGCRYYSFMENIDKTFYDLDQPYLLPTGIKKYREDHNNGSLVFDARISIKFAQNYSASVVSNNIFNLEYTLRPLKIETPRTIALQLTATL